jgi:hypothetical protein
LEESISKYRQPGGNDESVRQLSLEGVDSGTENKINVKSENIRKNEDNFSKVEVLDLGKGFVNFGICLPGQVMKRTICLKSLAQEDIELHIKFSTDESLNDKFRNILTENINAIYTNIQNSQIKYACFTINDNKDTTLTLTLKPEEVTNIEVILTTPFAKSKVDLFTNLDIFADNSLTINIPLQGYLEIPKLLCLKELHSDCAKLPLIAIQAEIKAKGQRFKIPFKNLSLVDLELDFILEKKFNDNIFKHNSSTYQCQFICFPNNLTIPAQATSTLDLIAKITKIEQEQQVADRIRKVLIAKARNANVFFTFFIEAFFK